MKQNYSDKEKAQAGLTAFFSIAKEWRLTEEQEKTLLGSPDDAKFNEWKKSKQGALSGDSLIRLSYIIGIYKSLQTLFSNELAIQWIHNENTLIDNKPPLEYMLSGQIHALSDIRHYLDNAEG